MEIRLEHVNKKYGKRVVLEDINLVIPHGMCGLVGRNGAGKTTLMRILSTLAVPNSGKVTINGLGLEKRQDIRRMIGYLPQEFSVYPSMTVYSALDYLGVLAGMPRKDRKEKIDCILQQVHLEEQRNQKFKQLSGGMKRRFGIAQALIHSPDVLIVDEPTVGLDPEERVRFNRLLQNLSNEKIVLLSTHILADIIELCERVIVLDRGKVIFFGDCKDFSGGEILDDIF